MPSLASSGRSASSGSPGESEERASGERYKRLLYMCALPPSGLSGLQIIARQVFSGYDPSSLHILCCRRSYGFDGVEGRTERLPCRHTTVPDYGIRSRPYRFTAPLSENLNCLRVPQIMLAAEKIIRDEAIEALFTIPFSTDFSVAAYLLHRRTGLPLYVFEMDDWEATNRVQLHGYLTRRYHGDLLRAAKKTWLISPAMVETFRERFGIEGTFLCQAVDVEAYQRAAKAAARSATRADIKLVYTGSVNSAFRETLRVICALVNAGMEVDGRRVRMEMYTQVPQPDLAGPGVTFPAYVPMDAIPGVLADADVLVMGVSFEKDAEAAVRTSLFTKMIDYLASGRPMLMVAPAYSAVARYARGGAEVEDTACVVDRLEPDAIEAGLRRILGEHEETARRCARGVDLVRRRHSLQSIDDIFLRHFRTPS